MRLTVSQPSARIAIMLSVGLSVAAWEASVRWGDWLTAGQAHGRVWSALLKQAWPTIGYMRQSSSAAGTRRGVVSIVWRLGSGAA